MTPRPTSLFTFTFIAITLLEMTSDTMHIGWLHYGSKPLIMALLLLYTGQHSRRAGSSSLIYWLVTGMVFALIGDVFLMIREVDLFAPGLGSFLIMQLCYCRTFWLVIRQSGQRIDVRSFWRRAIPFLIYDTAFLYMLYPVFSDSPALTYLWWPVVAYVFCLSSMGLLSTQVSGTKTDGFPLRSLHRYGSVGLGALLFILSDSIIAIDKFLYSIPGVTWLVMSTYAAAQYLIVVGIMHQIHPNKPIKSPMPGASEGVRHEASSNPVRLL